MSLARGSIAVLFLLFLLPLHAEEIVVASYNVRNYLKMDRWVDGKRQPDQPKPESEIQALVGVISHIKPDILGLIEIGDQSMLADLQSRLKTAGLDYPHSEWVRGADAVRHVCLLSRFPIVARNSRDDVPFELEGKRARITRGILDVTVEVNPKYRLRLLGAHLKSRLEVGSYDQEWLRAKEAWFLRQHVESILEKDPRVNLALFGDFNDTKNEYPVRELIGWRGSPNYMADIWLRDSRGERWTHYWKAADSYSRYDYILVSRGLFPEVNLKKSGIDDSPAWNEASDHRAIYTTISATDKR